ncbi:MAG: bifunctional riboflavin kinase/FAD synthetase [Solobacterium sp.]|nr:bifunctional riboflavin kinase/FAD synthetase [Solobacterium sp.]
MRIERIDLQHLRKIPMPTTACIGYFDGMHRGHQQLIEKTIALAKEHHCESSLITFDPDPEVTIFHLEDKKHITPLNQKINLAVRFGIKNVFIISFTKEMSELSPEDFIHKVLGCLDLKALVCGFDFHYGYKGAGNAETLQKETAFETYVINEIQEDGEKISSTRILNQLEEGKVDEVERLLGYPFEVDGYVRPGNHVGHQLGFPTANIYIHPSYQLPKPGVYAGYAYTQGKRYLAMINIGHNPTCNYQEDLSFEVHLLGFTGDLYGKRVRVLFKNYLREERKFKNIDNLRMQLEQDCFAVKRLLSQ